MRVVCLSAAVAATAAAGVVVAVVRAVLVPPTARVKDQRVLAVDRESGLITFSRTPDSAIDGRLGFWFDEDHGHARIGRIVSDTGTSITRELLRVDFGNIDAAGRGRFSGWFYLNPGDLGVDYENAVVETDLGPAPAWLVEPHRVGEPSGPSRWMIGVHGRAVTRSETLRSIPVFRSAGYTCLLISYRNDGEAPASEDGRYSLGDTEWRDVEAALQFALDHGATSVVLMGWSMGGATALQAADRSALAHVVDGLVLDSPVISWVDAIDHQARQRGVPRPLRMLAYSMIGQPWGKPLTGLRSPIDLSRLDFVKRAADLAVPTLILHSDGDDYIPSRPSRALAELRGDVVTLESFDTARHTRLWNYDPDRWNRTISDWLAALPARSAQPTSRTARCASRPEAG